MTNKFYQVESSCGGTIVELKEVRLESIDGTQTLVNDLSPYYSFIRRDGGVEQTLGEILTLSDNPYLYGKFYSKQELINYLTSLSKLSRDGKSIDYSLSLRECPFRKEVFCELLGLDIRNLRGGKYYKESKLTLSKNGLNDFIKDIQKYMLRELYDKSLKISKTSEGKEGRTQKEYFLNIVSIYETIVGIKKEEWVKLLENKYSFDSQGYEKKTILELVENMKESDSHFYVKEFIEKIK